MSLKGNDQFPASSPIWSVPFRKRGTIRACTTYCKDSPAAQHTLATRAAAYRRPRGWADATTDASKQQVRPQAAHRSPAAATVQRVCATAPAPRRAAPTSEGSGKDPGELGGDSLAEVIGWWTTRVRSRLRAGRGTRRGGGVFQDGSVKHPRAIRISVQALKQMLDHDIREIAEHPCLLSQPTPSHKPIPCNKSLFGSDSPLECWLTHSDEEK
ncbi:uncharacterized protein LOC116590222 [Mustela erminea]|uniref:uncharacterized protein LOC116590222 n=1 Tax=Mustela erminea TaxID=36723 RepID=UPI0013871192|nr:uncharacterized protein LOC116590222 [Mustela erminea]